MGTFNDLKCTACCTRLLPVDLHQIMVSVISKEMSLLFSTFVHVDSHGLSLGAGLKFEILHYHQSFCRGIFFL